MNVHQNPDVINTVQILIYQVISPGNSEKFSRARTKKIFSDDENSSIKSWKELISEEEVGRKVAEKVLNNRESADLFE